MSPYGGRWQVPPSAAGINTVKLVNTPSFQVQDGRATLSDLPDFLRLSSDAGESHAPTGNQSQTCLTEENYPGGGPTAFASVADSRIAVAGDNCHLLAGDTR
jgi:hypothetical protein